MASTSSTGNKRKNEDTRAFDGIAPATSTFASKRIKKPSYDVFINHRGPDVKSTLASVLYGILTGMALSVFLDSQELEYGDFFPQTIEAVMTTALLHIAIFSKRYAESAWCLAELSFMVESGVTIIPIFYHVEPNDLRYIHQGKGIYVDAFREHERKGRYSLEQLQEWKKALKDVSFYNGEIIKTPEDEARLLKNIVNCVLKEIKNVPLVVAKHPVGLEEIVQDFEMNTLQSAQSAQGVQIVGIWGMGGSGKTTLAKELYNKKSLSMQRSSFIFDVRDGAAKGLLQDKQNKLLNDLGVTNVKIDHTEEGKALLTRHLRSVSMLIVLDDVDHADQLDALLPAKNNLRGDSLIIVTTRECEVLTSWGISSVYKMRALDPFHAEQLFCWHAFLQSFPLDGFEELVKKFLDACQRLPLSLKVFGGQLYGKSCEYWESLLNKISRILPDDIKNILKVSYDALDYEEKEAFLDTACFFIGEEKSLAIEVWNGSGWSGLHSWERLLNKCLVELDSDNNIRMHDHLRDMGREIASQHSPSRLWLPEHAKQIEKRNEIRGIKAVDWRPYGEEFGAEISGGLLVGLKVFLFEGDFNEVICQVSRELLWLRWSEMGQRNLPVRLSLKNLRVLQLYEARKLEELWEAESDPPLQLRELVISTCSSFRGFPNSIGCLRELKNIVITCGNSLSSLPEEFCRLQSLEHLQLGGCVKLSSLPSSFGDLRNLRHLNLSGCRSLGRLPVSFKNLMLLQYLNLEYCEDLRFTSEDFQNIKKLEFLTLPWSEQSGELPRHITNQASLRELYLQGDLDEEWPPNMSWSPNMSLPNSLGDLGSLTRLHIYQCPALKRLPTSLGGLGSLTSLEIYQCPAFKCLPTSLVGLGSLTSLDIYQCPALKCLPTSLGGLGSLTSLCIYRCPALKCLPTSLGNLGSLTSLRINQCPALKCLPTSLGNLGFLTSLRINQCPALKCSLSVGSLNLLEVLSIEECPISHVDFEAAYISGRRIPFALSNLKRIFLRSTNVCRISIPEDRYPRLETLFLKCNNHLTEIGTLPTTVKSMTLRECEMLKIIRISGEMLPSFARLTSLTHFALDSCDRIEKITGLKYCTRLEMLKVNTCWEMLNFIKSLEHMKKLRQVRLKANKGSAIERCIQTIQEWPDEIVICARAIPDASSVVDSLLSPNLDELSSNGDATMFCFVVNCVSASYFQWALPRDGLSGSVKFRSSEKGRWALTGVFTQGGDVNVSEGDFEIEKRFVVRGKNQRLVDAFHSLLPILQS